MSIQYSRLEEYKGFALSQKWKRVLLYVYPRKKTYPVRVERGTKPKPIYWKEAFSRQTFSLAFNKTIDLNVLNKYKSSEYMLRIILYVWGWNRGSEPIFCFIPCKIIQPKNAKSSLPVSVQTLLPILSSTKIWIWADCPPHRRTS